MIAPPMLHISALKAALKVPVIVGAQHTAVQSVRACEYCHQGVVDANLVASLCSAPQGFGAFTGEHSTDMLKGT